MKIKLIDFTAVKNLAYECECRPAIGDKITVALSGGDSEVWVIKPATGAWFIEERRRPALVLEATWFGKEDLEGGGL